MQLTTARPHNGPIPLDHPAVQRVKDLIPVEYHTRTWIAGSAACRYPQAWDAGGDLDVWVCDVADREYDDLYKRLYTTERHQPVYEDYAILSRLVYAVDRVHILISTASIEAIVGEFDISCHAAAIRLDGADVYQHPQFSTSPIVLSWKDPVRTMLRCFRFVTRYNDGLAWHDSMTQQCAMEAFGLHAISKAQAKLLVEAGL